MGDVQHAYVRLVCHCCAYGRRIYLSYGLWFIPVTISAGSIIGCLLLAIGAVRSGTVDVRGLLPITQVGRE